MRTRAVLLPAAVAVLLLSSSCFGGGDDDGETLPTNTPDAPLDTPTQATGAGETPTAGATIEASTPTPSGPRTHTVQAGEFLATIADEYGITVGEILAANDIDNPDLIYPGQELVIPAPGSVTPVVPAATVAGGGAETPEPGDDAGDEDEAGEDDDSGE